MSIGNSYWLFQHKMGEDSSRKLHNRKLPYKDYWFRVDSALDTRNHLFRVSNSGWASWTALFITDVRKTEIFNSSSTYLKKTLPSLDWEARVNCSKTFIRENNRKQEGVLERNLPWSTKQDLWINTELDEIVKWYGQTKPPHTSDRQFLNIENR